mgnify:CR=1 FL=1
MADSETDFERLVSRHLLVMLALGIAIGAVTVITFGYGAHLFYSWCK